MKSAKKIAKDVIDAIRKDHGSVREDKRLVEAMLNHFADSRIEAAAQYVDDRHASGECGLSCKKFSDGIRTLKSKPSGEGKGAA